MEPAARWKKLRGITATGAVGPECERLALSTTRPLASAQVRRRVAAGASPSHCAGGRADRIPTFTGREGALRELLIEAIVKF